MGKGGKNFTACIYFIMTQIVPWTVVFTHALKLPLKLYKQRYRHTFHSFEGKTASKHCKCLQEIDLSDYVLKTIK